jgi:hypothetical protein
MHCFLGQLRCRRYAKSPRNKHIQVLTLFQGGGYLRLPFFMPKKYFRTMSKSLQLVRQYIE